MSPSSIPSSPPDNPEPDAERGTRVQPGVLLSNLLYIVYSLVVGFALLFLPWQDIWDNNYLVFLYPRLRPILVNPFLKGGVVGLGLVDIFIGIHEIANLKKGPRRILSR